jgi:hypothetical protein
MVGRYGERITPMEKELLLSFVSFSVGLGVRYRKDFMKTKDKK